MPRDEEPPSPSFGQALLALWRLSRPRIWTVSVLPAYVGYVLATRTLLPSPVHWTTLWHDAATRGVTPNRILATTADWITQSGDLLLGLATLGPLVWTATLLINDAYDLETDAQNPRKASSPLVQGVVDAGWTRRAAYTAALASLVASAFIGPAFLSLVAACLVLAWLYSVPPIRLKSRPGGDVAVNAIGIGALSGMAGWTLAEPLSTFPFLFLPQGVLVAIAVYVPTTLADQAADRAAGEQTIATALGSQQAYRVGWYAWIGANAGAILLSVNGWIIPQAFLPVLLVFVPLLLWEYHTFIGQADSQEALVEGLFLCALTFTAVNLLFAMVYTRLILL